MSLAKFRKVGTKTGAGRFVVSEGIAPAAYLLPSVGLPTWYKDSEDDRFEIVIPKGTILSVVNVGDDSRVVPANGTDTAVVWGDTIPGWNPLAGATPVGSPTGDGVTVPAFSLPIGVAQYDLYRPFDKGTSQGAGFITHGYVEYPMVTGINANVTVGSCVRADNMGRPVLQSDADTDYANYAHYLQVGKVIEIEKFATNFDDGLLSYMQLPSDPGALKTVYELTRSGANSGKLGIRANLDVTNVVGAFRVNLTL